MKKWKPALHVLVLHLLLAFLLSACRGSSEQKVPSPSDVTDSPTTIKLVFTYGSEKESWVKDVTNTFNESRQKTKGGRTIVVEAIPMGSGDCIEEITSGRRQTHITSPASAAFIKLGNAESRVKTGQDLLSATENLVLSPVVIAMWKPMAEAIGWGKKPIGWGDITKLARDRRGWAAYGFPQWGAFKFGHTHPEYSNSGLIALLAEAYAGANKVSGLSSADINKPATASFIQAIESSVVHYGTSTGFFSSKMFANGPEYLSAAVLYESNVIESYRGNSQLPFPVVAIYPKEGTFWSDHPIGIVEREWVTPDHREAARTYIQFLLSRPQQEKALTYGFRPASVDIPVSSPVDADHGIDPNEPKTTLEVPPADVISSLFGVWEVNKRHSNIVLVFDTSGSMSEANRMPNAKAGALQLIDILADKDTVSLLPFNSQVSWARTDLLMASDREEAKSTINSLFPGGDTALYDAIAEAAKYLSAHSDPDRIMAIVVLTDGEDNRSQTTLNQLLQNVAFNAERNTTRIFTIGYGSAAGKSALQKIADTTQARFYEGTPQNIRLVFKEVSTFF